MVFYPGVAPVAFMNQPIHFRYLFSSSRRLPWAHCSLPFAFQEASSGLSCLIICLLLLLSCRFQPLDSVAFCLRWVSFSRRSGYPPAK